ncbi:MAG: hypothetical protein Q7S59_00430 [Sulfurimonas sp.]|nr:hypothetical protein [Sulfurimonas sp.]
MNTTTLGLIWTVIVYATIGTTVLIGTNYEYLERKANTLLEKESIANVVKKDIIDILKGNRNTERLSSYKLGYKSTGFDNLMMYEVENDYIRREHSYEKQKIKSTKMDINIREFVNKYEFDEKDIAETIKAIESIFDKKPEVKYYYSSIVISEFNREDIKDVYK